MTKPCSSGFHRLAEAWDALFLSDTRTGRPVGQARSGEFLSLTVRQYKGGFVTETGEWLDSAGSSMLAAVARAESDATGVETFKRYLWQAKQAVRLWLSCLTETDGPLYVLCERVEDVTLVYPSKVRFMQMKTRDRGSWSASVMGSSQPEIAGQRAGMRRLGCARAGGSS